MSQQNERQSGAGDGGRDEGRVDGMYVVLSFKIIERHCLNEN